MSSNWYLYNKGKNAKEISQKFGISPLASVILCNREITTDKNIKMILSSNIDDINDSKLLPDVDIACKKINEAVKEGKSIRVIGDYDIDGVCASYILCDAIRKIGGNVSYAIPDRISEGYGINISLIDTAIRDKIDLIITCDNGITANEQISYAKSHGIEVIVTDHHDIADIPKDALAIVNPKRKDVKEPYPFEGISGGVVAWKLMMRYYELYLDKKDEIIENYLEFAMLSTIGDIMSLCDENHIIAKLGLSKILYTKNEGLKKLLDVTGIDFKNKGITVYHIGYIIGPLINAAGRMDKATLALELFLSNDKDEISSIVTTLKELNDDRKKMTDNGVKLAIKKIEDNFKNDKVIVVLVEGLGEQVAGIVAGRIKDKYNRPTIIITNTQNENECKASCRSIENYDIYDALCKHKDLFLKFGGHKLAAGFSIESHNIDILRKYLNDECHLTDSDFIQKLHIDVDLPFYEFSEPIIKEMETLEPFGQGFARPVFATKKVDVSIKNIYGDEQNIIHLNLKKDGKLLKGVMFSDSDKLKNRLEKNAEIDIVYYPRINEYKDYKSVEINVLEYR